MDLIASRSPPGQQGFEMGPLLSLGGRLYREFCNVGFELRRRHFGVVWGAFWLPWAPFWTSGGVPGLPFGCPGKAEGAKNDTGGSPKTNLESPRLHQEPPRLPVQNKVTPRGTILEPKSSKFATQLRKRASQKIPWTESVQKSRHPGPSKP